MYNIVLDNSILTLIQFLIIKRCFVYDLLCWLQKVVFTTILKAKVTCPFNAVQW